MNECAAGQRQGLAVKKWPMHGIGQILHDQNPVRSPLGFANEAAVFRVFKFLRNDERRNRNAPVFRKVRPDEARAFVRLERFELKPRSKLGLGDLACGYGDTLAGSVVAPAVIRAAQHSIDDHSDAEFGAAMETTVVMNANLAVWVAPDDDVVAETLEPERPLLHVPRLANRIPHVLDTQLQFGFKLDLLRCVHWFGKMSRCSGGL